MKKNTLKLVSIFTIILGVFFLKPSFQIFSGVLTDKFDIFNIIGTILLSILMGIPGYLCVFFGIKFLLKKTENNIKYLIGSLTFPLAYYVFWNIEGRISLPSSFIQSSTLDIALIIVSISALIFYWFVSRYILKIEGYTLPPVSQSLSKLPIAIIAFVLFTSTDEIFEDIINTSDNTLAKQSIEGIAIFCSIFISWVFYLICKALFVKKKEPEHDTSL